MKKATPSRFMVERVGTPDPETSEYYVLDVVQDQEARAALRGLVRRYRVLGAPMKADELETLLDETDSAHAEVVWARQNRMMR